MFYNRDHFFDSPLLEMRKNVFFSVQKSYYKGLIHLNKKSSNTDLLLLFGIYAVDLTVVM